MQKTNEVVIRWFWFCRSWADPTHGPDENDFGWFLHWLFVYSYCFVFFLLLILLHVNITSLSFTLPHTHFHFTAFEYNLAVDGTRCPMMNVVWQAIQINNSIPYDVKEVEPCWGFFQHWCRLHSFSSFSLSVALGVTAFIANLKCVTSKCINDDDDDVRII